MSTDSSELTFSNDPAPPPPSIEPAAEGSRQGSVWAALRDKAREFFGLDLRALALFRILLGIVILYDIFLRVEAGGLEAFYTDQGALPRAAQIEQGMSPWQWSVHLLGGTSAVAAMLFAIQGLLALAFIGGVKTRWATVFLWGMILSLQNRNLMVLTGADVMLRVILFWSMFLPLGARWSVDSLTAPQAANERPRWIVTLASLAFILQICFVYWFTVALKTDPVWRRGDAVFYALHLDQFARPFGVWLREQDWAIKPLGYGAFYWEILGACLLFVPFKTRWFRLAAALGLIGFHLGLELTMDLGVFAWVCIAAWAALLPSVAVDWLESRKIWKGAARLFGGVARYLAGRWRWLRAVRAPGLRPSALNSAIVFFCLIYVFAWNLRTISNDFAQWFPSKWNGLGLALGLNQKWSMFAPKPAVHDGWFVVEAKLLNGEVVDILRNERTVSFAKPDNLVAEYPNRRWSKYLERLRVDAGTTHRTGFSRYLTRRWNREHEYAEHAQEFTVWYVRETTGPDGPMAPHRFELWRHTAARPRRWAVPPPEPAQEEPSAADDIPSLPVEESADISDGGVEQP